MTSTRSSAARLSGDAVAVALVSVCLLITGCGDSPTQPRPTTSRATAIHIVSETAFCRLTVPVFLDGALAATLSIPGEVTIPVTAGSHDVQIEDLSHPSSRVSVPAGQTVEFLLSYSCH